MIQKWWSFDGLLLYAIYCRAEKCKLPERTGEFLRYIWQEAAIHSWPWKRRGLGRIIQRRYRQHGIVGFKFFISLSSCIFITLFLLPGQIPEWSPFWGKYTILRIWQPGRSLDTALFHNRKLSSDLHYGLQTEPSAMAQDLAFYSGIIQCRASVFL